MLNLELNINNVLDAAQKGVRAKTDSVLIQLKEIIYKDPFVLWNEDESLIGLSKCCMLMVFYDLFDDEETEIALIQYAYVYLSRAYELQNIGEEKITEKQFLVLRDRIALLDSYTDSFTHTIAGFYLKSGYKVGDDAYLGALQLANYKISNMIVFDIFSCESWAQDLQNDEYLIEVSNRIEDNQKLRKNEIMEAAFLHHKLFDAILSDMKEIAD